MKLSYISYKILLEFFLLVAVLLIVNHTVFSLSTPDTENHFFTFQDEDYAYGFLAVNLSPVWYFISVTLNGINLFTYSVIVFLISYFYFRQLLRVFNSVEHVKTIIVLQMLFYSLNMNIMVASAVRQTLALGVIFYIYNNKDNYNNSILLILIFLAFLTHPFITIIFTFFYFAKILNNFSLSKLILLFFGFGILIYVFDDQISSKFIDYSLNEDHENPILKAFTCLILFAVIRIFILFDNSLLTDFIALLKLFTSITLFVICTLFFIPSVGVRVYNIIYILFIPLLVYFFLHFLSRMCRYEPSNSLRLK